MPPRKAASGKETKKSQRVQLSRGYKAYCLNCMVKMCQDQDFYEHHIYRNACPHHQDTPSGKGNLVNHNDGFQKARQVFERLGRAEDIEAERDPDWMDEEFLEEIKQIKPKTWHLSDDHGRLLIKIRSILPADRVLSQWWDNAVAGQYETEDENEKKWCPPNNPYDIRDRPGEVGIGDLAESSEEEEAGTAKHKPIVVDDGDE